MLSLGTRRSSSWSSTSSTSNGCLLRASMLLSHVVFLYVCSSFSLNGILKCHSKHSEQTYLLVTLPLDKQPCRKYTQYFATSPSSPKLSHGPLTIPDPWPLWLQVCHTNSHNSLCQPFPRLLLCPTIRRKQSQTACGHFKLQAFNVHFQRKMKATFAQS